MKRFLKNHRNDLLLTGAILSAALLIFLGFLIFRKPGGTAVVEQDGKVLYRLSLSEDCEVLAGTPETGYNRIVVADGKVCVSEADCRDQICVRKGRIHAAGDTIVCLPHRLVVTVEAEGGEEDE